ncbi:MAG: methyltransferase domain-containing protein [Bacteroidia bacterium]
METIILGRKPRKTAPSNRAKLLRHYNEAGMDYRTWSRDFNMHFGYYKPGMNPLDRRKMLEQMNMEVLQTLGLQGATGLCILDLGCGLGATARTGAKSFPGNNFHGITLVDWQVQKGRELINKQGLSEAVTLQRADYTATPFPNGYADATYAIESACHDSSPNKECFIQEMSRLLKPDGRFAIADAFLKTPEAQFHPLLYKAYNKICDHWAVPGMAQINRFEKLLRKYDLTDICIKEISLNIAPSVLHAPALVIWFLIKNLLKGKLPGPTTLQHLEACLLSPLMGLARKNFGYFIITGKKLH